MQGGSLDTSVNYAKLQDITLHKTKIGITTVVRTSNPANYEYESPYYEFSTCSYLANIAVRMP